MGTFQERKDPRKSFSFLFDSSANANFSSQATKKMLSDAWLWILVVICVLALLFLMVYNVSRATLSLQKRTEKMGVSSHGRHQVERETRNSCGRKHQVAATAVPQCPSAEPTISITISINAEFFPFFLKNPMMDLTVAAPGGLPRGTTRTCRCWPLTS